MANLLPSFLGALSAVAVTASNARVEDLVACEVALCLANSDGLTAAQVCPFSIERLAKQS
jgi:hypothetical protein